MPTGGTNERVIDTRKPKLHQRAHAHVSHHYFRVMPNKKHHRTLVWVVFLLCSFVVSAQMLYPNDRSLPLAKLEGAPIGWREDEALAGELAKRFDKTTIDITTASGETYSAKLATAGAEQQASVAIEALSQYPFAQRLMPFSILWQRPTVQSSSVIFSAVTVKEFSKKAAAALSHSPINASLVLKEGVLVPKSDKDGQTVRAEDIQRALETHSQYKLGKTNVAIVPAAVVTPQTSSADFTAVRAAAEIALERTIALTINGDIIEPSSVDKASWLEIASDTSGDPKLALKVPALEKYLASLNKKYGKTAGFTEVSIVNGVETNRSIGKKGKSIDTAAAVKDIRSVLLRESPENTTLVQLTFADIAAGIRYNGRYTSTEEGLQAYVADTTRDGSIAIAIKQVDGNRWSAEGGAGESRVSASTFKLYVALYLFEEMKKGTTDWNDSMLDTTVSGCFDRMTIASTNPCAYEWLNKWGRSNLNQYLYSKGFSTSTTFTNPTATHTSANDLRRYMLGLENGSLVGGVYRDRLLHSLSSHPYRYGVPTGSAGTVHDKVGFLWDYVHDAAIVSHPKGKYVIVVMTKGHSYAKIANITREVEKIMYP